MVLILHIIEGLKFITFNMFYKNIYYRFSVALPINIKSTKYLKLNPLLIDILLIIYLFSNKAIRIVNLGLSCSNYF